MAQFPCYSGSNPLGKLSDASKKRAWEWFRDNVLTHAMPLEAAHKELSNYFGMHLKPEWINEFLAARKTPFRVQSDAAWVAQANRREIQHRAQAAVRTQSQSKLMKAASLIAAAPRYTTLGGGLHTVVFPFSHAGGLILNPLRWGSFARLLRNTYRVADPLGGARARANFEQLMTSMRQSPRYDLARKSGVDFSAHGGETPGGSGASRGFGALIEGRFRMWDAAMEQDIKPGMSADDIDSLGREFATWANHATGSGKGLLTARIPIGKDKSISLAPLQFGPKLYQSYWNRLLGDPLQTIKTFAQWGASRFGADAPSAGEKAVAMRRLQGATTVALTYTGMLYANQALLQATGQKDQINWTDPTKSDWLSPKWYGFTFGLPGLPRSEIRLIGQILVSQNMTKDQLAASGMFPAGVPKYDLKPNQLASLRQQYVARQLLQYARGKAAPIIGLEEELRTGHDFMGRPLPWSGDKGDKKHEPLSWGQYAWSHAPIPLSGAAKYVYDQLRAQGASVTDASMWMRAAMVAGASAFAGTELKEIKPETHRTRGGHVQVGR